MLPAECWDALLAAAAAQADVDIASPQRPQRWDFKFTVDPQEFTVVVALSRTKRSETMTIEIAAVAPGPQQASDETDANRSRFWT
jgi:hypothetical protein